MNKYFYTFGTADYFPHYGGWVEVMADDWGWADTKFTDFYPLHNDMINCAFRYTESEFQATGMHKTGNIGNYCHKRIA